MEQLDWEKLSPAEKKEQLYIKQKHLLGLFLEKNAISKEQYDKSLSDLTEKMGLEEVENDEQTRPISGIQI